MSKMPSKNLETKTQPTPESLEATRAIYIEAGLPPGSIDAIMSAENVRVQQFTQPSEDVPPPPSSEPAPIVS
jgi:cell envelope opacity-associated protein A